MEGRPYTINGSWDKGQTVSKLWYGDRKFVIVKCKDEYNSMKTIEKDLAAFIRGGVNRPDNMYFHLFNYVKANPNKQFIVETLLFGASGYELLKFEYEMLKAGRHDKNMLNNNTAPYIPQFKGETGMYGWISRPHVMAYQRWLKAHKPGRKKAAQ